MNTFLRNLLWPRLDLRYYLIYLQTWQQIGLLQSHSLIRCIKLVISLIWFECFKYICIQLTDPPEVTRVILYDGFYLMVPKNGLASMTAVMIAMAAYLFHLCYQQRTDAHICLYSLLYDILFLNKPVTLLWGTNANGSSVCMALQRFSTKILILQPVFYGPLCKCYRQGVPKGGGKH